MSRTLKVILIVGIALILGGGLFYGAAYAIGERYTDSRIGNYEETVSLSADVRNFKIDTAVAQVNIKNASDNKFKIDAQDIYTDDFKYEVKNNTLEITYNPNWNRSGFGNIWIFGISIGENHRPVINLYIPENTAFDDFSIDGGVGEYNIEYINADSFRLKGGVGKLIVKDSKIDKLKIDVGVGEYDINGDIGEMDITGGVGMVKVSGLIARDIKIDGGVGEVKLNMTGNIDNYDIRASSGVGTVRINGENADYYRNSGAPYKLNVSGGVGSISINIK